MFNIYFRPKALELLKKIKREDQLKINFALDGLKLKKFNTLDLKRIKGTKNGWRLRLV
jgi:mRNA-degrading endonuclease RelE of RelBE toxin-antitoxin system